MSLNCVNLLKNKLKVVVGLNSRGLCAKPPLKPFGIEKLRNIGILAHIDAGKTTTTERMLFYSGTIKQMGEVHHGNTVTDFMEQERDRGITIRSAAVTFPWKGHLFNLIDTPGHIDFTMEVEQTLDVLDGAVIVLDGSAGVEAQTLTVWRQSERYNIPKIVFANKMDRIDSDLQMCCESIERKFDVPALPLQVPIREHNKLIGLIDVLSLERIIWEKDLFSSEVLEEKDGALWETAMAARLDIIDKLSGYDDGLADIIIATESLDNMKSEDLVQSIRKCVLEQSTVPVLCGSAYKNLGIQPLMDSIVLYLPHPKNKFSCFEGNLCAKAFKVMHDRQRGPLVFFRVYSGGLTKGQKIYNVHKKVSEQSSKLLVALADDYWEVSEVQNGNIAVVTGLKQTATGDLITSSSTAAQNAHKKMKSATSDQSEIDRVFKFGAKIPPPVFFCSIEPPSLAYQSALEQALVELQREDPSLRVTQETETGQTVLAGMGELHLEIIKDRILKEYKIEADLGPLQISYREAPLRKVTTELTTSSKIGNSRQSVTVRMSVLPTETDDGKGVFRLDKTPEAASGLANIFPKHLLAVQQGVEVGLAHGPKVGSPVVNLQVVLHFLEVGRGTSDTIIAATATQCVQKLVKEAGSSILEPIMYLEVGTPDEYLSGVLADLSRRRAVIQNVTVKANNKLVVCETPLSDLMGYSTTLRTITSGTGVFSMEFVEYKAMSSTDEAKAIESVRGF